MNMNSCSYSHKKDAEMSGDKMVVEIDAYSPEQSQYSGADKQVNLTLLDSSKQLITSRHLRGPSQQRSQEKLSRLVAAVRKLVNGQELESIRIVDIASEAGVATGTVYQRFRDKEDLLGAVLDQYSGEMLARICGALKEGATQGEPQAIVAALSASLVAEYRENRGLMKAATRFWGAEHQVGGPMKSMAVAIGVELLHRLEPHMEKLRVDHPQRMISQALHFMFGILMFEAATDAGPLRLSEDYIEQELTDMFCRYTRLESAL